MGACAAHHRADTIAFSSLPTSIGTYLTANYSGYTFKKAFADKDASGNVAGYVLMIDYNGKPVGIKFDATGAFVRVLEQREGRDLGGRGFHPSGHFDDRDGLKRDTLAISALPASVISYFASNYATDTLVRAFRGKDSSIVVLSVNNGPFATVFDANGTFVSHAALPARPGRPASVTQEALPPATLTYLSTTYPNYVFKHAFILKNNGVTNGYAVFIDANATKYAISFDSSGNFVKAVTVR
ncbi:MAG: PepSY-like domain-containing protein [Bacteroidota bacterium]|nr:PepSY-like domain-containing protein [Bacteroidota bacterium]